MEWELTVLEWMPAIIGMEQELEITVHGPRRADSVLEEFNRQYGGGVMTFDGNMATIDSTTHCVAWSFPVTLR